MTTEEKPLVKRWRVEATETCPRRPDGTRRQTLIVYAAEEEGARSLLRQHVFHGEADAELVVAGEVEPDGTTVFDENEVTTLYEGRTHGFGP